MLFQRVEGYSKIIQNDELLKQEWHKYIAKTYTSYIDLLSPISSVNNRYIRALLRKFGLMKINERSAALLLNLMRCEAHADLSKEALAQNLKK